MLNHDIGHKQKDEFLVTSNVNSFDYFLWKKKYPYGRNLWVLEYFLQRLQISKFPGNVCSLTVICGFIISVLLDDALRSARAHTELPKMECVLTCTMLVT